MRAQRRSTAFAPAGYPDRRDNIAAKPPCPGTPKGRNKGAARADRRKKRGVPVSNPVRKRKGSAAGRTLVAQRDMPSAT